MDFLSLLTRGNRSAIIKERSVPTIAKTAIRINKKLRTNDAVTPLLQFDYDRIVTDIPLKLRGEEKSAAAVKLFLKPPRFVTNWEKVGSCCG